MNDEIFVQILRQAMMGDEKAINTIIEEYGNIIHKYCCDSKGINEDCKQYIKSIIIRDIRNFKNF